MKNQKYDTGLEQAITQKEIHNSYLRRYMSIQTQLISPGSWKCLFREHHIFSSSLLFKKVKDLPSLRKSVEGPIGTLYALTMELQDIATKRRLEQLDPGHLEKYL
ncbi:MAG: hypothetical protein [Cressdnaviricota sp.]|nr:MAG: hypothetical protein [Cressdnaviricota sp.]